MNQTLTYLKTYQHKSVSSYQAAIQSQVRAFYRNDIRLFVFLDTMVRIIDTNLTDAFNQGAAECGVRTNELTVDENIARQQFVDNQLQYLFSFGEAIRRGQNLAKIGEMLNRGEMWANRWREAYALGNQMACGNQKKLWQFDPSKEHCPDCMAMNGRVYRNATWLRYDIQPGSSALCCFGGHCGCDLINTTLPITPGRPPALKGPGC